MRLKGVKLNCKEIIDFYHDFFIFFPIPEITQTDRCNILTKSGIQKSGTVHITLKRFDICLKRGLAQGLDVD